MNFFISNALATTNTMLQTNFYSLAILVIIFFLVFYFMILRPQQKRIKQHKELISSLSKGDEIMTSGGLIGRVTRITNNGYISIAINDNNEVIIKRDFVAAVLPKGTIKSL